jgi:formylglycine-generating enzyme required for sulfatase activity
MTLKNTSTAHVSSQRQLSQHPFANLRTNAMQTLTRFVAPVLAAASVVGTVEAAFTGYTVVATPVTSGGQNLVRYEVFANFNGATDTVLNVFNFTSTGASAGEDAYGNFWHKDNSDYNGGVLSTEYGTWAPQLVGGATTNRPFDSFLLIGGNPSGTNTSNCDPSWNSGGSGSHAGSAAGWSRADLVNNPTIGWFNSSPPNNQGRVNVAPNTATQVKLGQFVLSQGHGTRTYSLRTAYNNGQPPVVFADATFTLCSITGYLDVDGDGFGSAASGTVPGCPSIPAGYVSNNLDCNDSNAAINPNTVWSRDVDGDGFGSAGGGTVTQCAQPAGYVLSNTDCNDGNAAINPNTVWSRDLDGDGFGFAADGTLTQCAQPKGYVLNATDNCPDDANPTQSDCDGDGVGDACDPDYVDCDADGLCDAIELAAPGGDTNGNGVLDDCERVFGDVNLDGIVSAADLMYLLSQWGAAEPEFGDLNLDGMIDGADISILLANWGQGFGGQPPIAIASITPAEGPSTGGTAIVISGTNLTGVTSVTVGGAAATAVVVVSPNTVTAVTPAGEVGARDVVATAGPRSAVKAGGFTYTQPLAWATVLQQHPDPAVVTDANLRNAIIATGLPWRVRDNGTQIEMVLIPPGTFNMGCTASNQQPCDSDESPVHSVTLTSAFYMGRYEVTQAQWIARMGSNPSYWVARAENGNTANTNRPVETVSWNQIAGAGGFLSGTGLRLPTEAEWEYACRAGTTTAFHGFTGYLSGTNDDTLVGNIAWFSGNNGASGTPTYGTKAVGQKLANGFGLHDMSGNVTEWVNDWYSSSYYASSPSSNPTGPATGTYRELRGGYWGIDAVHVRSSNRNYAYPSPDASFYDVGFRVARAPL